MDRTIGFIGTGNMGSAMIEGLLARGSVKEDRLFISDRNEAALKKLKNRWPGISASTDNGETVRRSDILVLAVKPHIYSAVIAEIAPLVDQSAIIVTIAAGITIGQVEEMFGKPVKIFRTMPNTPALVGEGVIAYCCNPLVTEEEEQTVVPLFESLGIVEKVGEMHFHSAIAVSGSSPAYVFMIIEAMADAAVLQGLPRAQAIVWPLRRFSERQKWSVTEIGIPES